MADRGPQAGDRHGRAGVGPRFGREHGDRRRIPPRVRGDLQVRVPMVGGRIENVVAGQMAEGFAKIQRFTAEWIADHV